MKKLLTILKIIIPCIIIFFDFLLIINYKYKEDIHFNYWFSSDYCHISTYNLDFFREELKFCKKIENYEKEKYEEEHKKDIIGYFYSFDGYTSLINSNCFYNDLIIPRNLKDGKYNILRDGTIIKYD